LANTDEKHVRAARRRIQTMVENGSLKPVGERKCVVCKDPATEYDHVAGYTGDGPESVEPICSSCHHKRTAKRGLSAGAPSVVWIDAYKMGSKVYHSSGNIEITLEFAASITRNFRVLKSRGYSVTFLREHGRVDSFVYGDVVDTRVQEGWLSLAVVMTRDEERKAYNEGILREFSPGFSMDWQDPHTGEMMGPTLLEVSFTSMAHQRNLRVPNDINPGVVLSNQHPMLYLEGNVTVKKLAAEELPEVAKEETIEMAEPTLVDIAAMLTELLALARPAEVDATELISDDKEDPTVKMSARIAQLEGDNVRLELSARGIKGDIVADLILLSAVNRPLYVKTVKALAAPQAEIGVTGQAATHVKFSAKDVALAAVAAGQTGHGRLAAFVAINHPEFKINDVRAALSAK